MLKIKIIILVSSLLCSVVKSVAQCPAAMPLKIDTITAESRCQASGKVTINVSGGASPYMYSVISGPLTFPVQSGNMFQSLVAGTYTVQVSDQCSSTITRQFTITGAYTIPLVSAILKSPSCHGSSDGSIDVQVSNGRPVFSYSLISPSPVIVAPQAGKLFTGLPAGDYTYKVEDSCGNFQTRIVTLADIADNNFRIYGSRLKWEACDSFSLPYEVISDDGANFNNPFMAKLTLPDGSIVTHVINTPGAIINDTFHFRFHHVTGNSDLLLINVTNACGFTKSYNYPMNVLDMTARSALTGGCSGQYIYTFDEEKDNNPLNPIPWVLHCSSITYTLVNAAGTVVAVQNNNSVFTGFPAGNGYKVIRQDCCSKDSLTFNWLPPAPKLKINSVNTFPACLEGTASISINTNSTSIGTVIIASGPTSITLASGTIHTYTYPDTIRNHPLGGPVSKEIGYFAEGTYKIYVLDSCNQTDSISLVIPTARIKHVTLSASLTKGCAGGSKIVWNGTASNTGDYITTSPSIGGFRSVSTLTFKDSIINLAANTYRITYHYTGLIMKSYLRGMANYGCDNLSRVVVVPPYLQPSFAQQPAIAACGPNRNVALLADSSRGMMPFQFQVTAGPVTPGIQADNVFTGMPKGTYTFRMTDACGNSFSNSIFIDTLIIPLPATTGGSCNGDVTTLSLPSNPYFQYTWKHPNGSISTGNSITMNPITPVDTGTYMITAKGDISGCVDSSLLSAKLKFCILLPLRPPLITVEKKNNGRLTASPSVIGYETSIMVGYPEVIKSAVLQVIDISGKVIMKKLLVKGSVQTSIDAGGLANGTYVLVFEGDDKRMMLPVVKQR